MVARRQIVAAGLVKSIRFEVWLAGYNKQVQSKYWKLFKESAWSKYHLVSTTQGADSILEHILVEHPDYSDLNALTKQIERGTLIFINDVDRILSEHNDRIT